MLCFSLVSERREQPGWDLESGLFFSNSVCVRGVGAGGEAMEGGGTEVGGARRVAGVEKSQLLHVLAAVTPLVAWQLVSQSPDTEGR